MKKEYRIPLIKYTFYKEKETKSKLISFIEKAEKLSMGEMVKLFEDKFAKWLGTKYTVMFNSGSSANLALLQALINLGWLRKGEYVGVSGITWSTNVMPIIQMGLKPVPIDIDMKTLNVCSDELEKQFEKFKFKAFFLTHLLGFCGDLERIVSFCLENNIILLEDNCESYGSEYMKQKLGTFGLASTCSFFVGHQMSTIEGGMVCTDNKELYDMLKIVRAHGWARDLDEETQLLYKQYYNIDDFFFKYTFFDLGYNLRPTEIQGFLGLIQLEYIDEIVDKREKNFYYLSKLYDIFDKFFYKINNPKITKLANFGFPIICKDITIRKKLVIFLEERGIETRPIVARSIIDQPFFKKYFKHTKFSLDIANFVSDAGLYIGNNPDLSSDDLEYIIQTISIFLSKV